MDNIYEQPGVDEDNYEDMPENDQSEEEVIIQALIARGDNVMYEDPHFPASDSSLYKNPNRPPDYADEEPRSTYGPHPWYRPEEYTVAPDYFKGGSGAGDVIQGSLGDCWLIGALASVASHPNQLIENIFGSEADDFKRYGVYTCRFYRNGEWAEVTTDTRIPYGVNEEGNLYNCPVYARCRNQDEIWVPFVEKAYAKLNRNYEALNGGSVSEALVDLTGGVAEKMLLTDPKIQAMVENGQLWTRMKRYMEWNYMMCCSMSVHGGNFEDEGAQGILQNHAYSIIYIKEVGPLKFLKVRNPWGKCEWRGEWSDGDSKWEDHPEVEAAMQDDRDANFNRDVDDGTFWIVWEDFVVNFNKIYLCRLFDDSQFKQYCVKGEWAGKSAAGAHKAMAFADSGSGKAGKAGADSASSSSSSNNNGGKNGNESDSKRIQKTDGDPSWFNNPQYRITCTEPAEVFISLMQHGTGLSAQGQPKEKFSMNFVVLRQKRGEKGRAWEQDPADVIADASAANFAYAYPQREVCKGNIRLSPKYSYVVVPHTLKRGVEAEFSMRLFSREELRVAPVPAVHMAKLDGTWDKTSSRDTAGGPLRVKGEFGFQDNAKWCQNPQYWLTLPPGTTERTTLKLVLRRTDRPAKEAKGGRDSRKAEEYVQLTVLRVKPNEDDSKRFKKAEKRTNPLGEELPGKASSLRRPGGNNNNSTMSMSMSVDGMNSTVGGAEEKPREPPERQLTVARQEWCQLTDGNSKEVATCLMIDLNQTVIPDGLLVVPCLNTPGGRGRFTLEVHSDSSVALEELPEARSQTVAAEWAEATAGGSHLNADWKRNPKFHLRLLSDRPAKVKITLTRPESVWQSQCKRDTVGNMMGFYLMVGSKPNRDTGNIMHDSRPWNESAFVPMHSVSTPQNFYLEPLMDEEVYCIMPAIFEPKHTGPFMLSVTTDVDFQLKKDRGERGK
jgi:hypothetical protein